MLLFDCETDGLLRDVTRIHVLVIKDTLTGERYVYRQENMEEGVRMLMSWAPIAGHNVINFDIPVIQKLYPWFTVDESKVFDTLVASRVIWPDMKDSDRKLVLKGKLPSKMVNKHSLEAWGYRLGNNKIDYVKACEEQGIDPWGGWNPLMEEYCIQDVEVTHDLLKLEETKMYPRRCIDLEHQVAWIIARQERKGVCFNEQAAVSLMGNLVQRKLELEDELRAVFKPFYLRDGKHDFTPRADSKKFGYVNGAPLCKVVLTEFNPGSRQQIVNRLKTLYGWVPEKFTEKGQPQVDEKVLEGLDYPNVNLLAEYFLVDKRLGQIATGDEAWLKHVRKGRIHGAMNTNGAVTGRATHFSPNLGQVPKVGKPHGKECRAMFGVPPGKKLVGADLSGLELRCLAHYMAFYDQGAYGQVLLEGDIHTTNQEAAGLPTRDNAKTFIYGFLYGAGDEKIGKIVGGTRQHGSRLRARFLKKLPALGKLVEAVQDRVKKQGYLVGLDGRFLHIRSSHAALNTLLQSAGALIAKQSLVNFDQEVVKRGWRDRVQQVLWVHDEIQVECDQELAEEVAKVAVWSFEEAGRQFSFRCPITGEAKIGNNWAETH